MATLTIRKLDESIKQSLRIQAAHHGVSMEEEARRILRKALLQDDGREKLGSRIHRYFAELGGIEENILPARSQPRPAPDFTDVQES